MERGKFFYVYILVSEGNPDRHYTGLTKDLEARLTKHNEGGVPATAPFRPWRIEIALAFRDTNGAGVSLRSLHVENPLDNVRQFTDDPAERDDP